MAISPFRPKYSTRLFILLLLAGAMASAQYAQRQISKGPRAVALLQLPENGKGRLIPIAIMVDGRFYDGSIYKANPVPMTLEDGIVYEAVRTGSSLGLFTVTGAARHQDSWIGEGTWQPAGVTTSTPTRKAETKPRESEEKPPLLRRPGPEPPKSDNKLPTPQAPPVAPPPAPPASTPSPQDSDHPRLRRGVPSPTAPEETSGKSAPGPAAEKKAASPPSPAGKVQIVAAISDAGGPEPRPYTYSMKPDEEQAFRKKMLALATVELNKKLKQLQPEPATAPPTRTSRGTRRAPVPKSPQPIFDDVKLRVFDISASNEPTLVLTAKARLPNAASQAPHDVTLIARTDLYGELRKLLSAVTDSQHLDVTPRLELIDAVDADGDTRAELLFRRISDAGSAYVIYRVGADQLWPLFEGTPSSP